MLTNFWEHNGIKLKFTFYSGSEESNFEPYTQAYAVCFRNDGKIIIGFTPSEYHDWLLPGGTREKGEDGPITLKRELREELSLEMIKCKLIGAQKVEYLNVDKQAYYQLRYVALVKVHKLMPDPDYGVMWKRKAIAAENFSDFLKWGTIGEHIVNESVKWYQQESFFKSGFVKTNLLENRDDGVKKDAFLEDIIKKK